MNLYQQNRPKIQPLDIVAFSGSRHPMARLIARVTKSPITHVGIVLRIGQRLFLYEAVPSGVRPILLSRRVETARARIEVYRRPIYAVDVDNITHRALGFAANRYDFVGLIRFYVSLLTSGRPRPTPNALFCSELVARSFGDDSADFVSPADVVAGLQHVCALKDA